MADGVVDDVAERPRAAAARRRRWRRRRAARARACRGRGSACSSGAWPSESWIASGPAATSVSTTRCHVLDAGEEARLAEEAVVDGDVDAAARGGVEEAVQAVGGGHAPIIGRPPVGSAWKDPAAVVIAGPNLTIDRTLSIDELRPGEVLRFERAVVSPGGKGVNVARVARELGAARRARRLRAGADRGRGGGAAGRRGASSLRGVEVGGELRSTAVVLERSGRVTVFNEPGPPLAPGDWERYEAAVARRRWRASACWRAADRCRRGAPDDAYARLVALARGRGRAGGRRRRGRAAGGGAGRGRRRGDARTSPRPRGCCTAAPTRRWRPATARGARARAGGGAGAGASAARGGRWSLRRRRGRRWPMAREAWWLAGLSVAAVRNPIGAGDALVGGLALALERGEAFAAAVAAGMACGAASVETDVAGVVVPARVAELLAWSDRLALAALPALTASPRGSGAVAARTVRGRPPRG